MQVKLQRAIILAQVKLHHAIVLKVKLQFETLQNIFRISVIIEIN